MYEPQEVQDRLIEALSIQSRTRSGSVGPKAYGNNWPEFRRSLWEDAPPDAITKDAVPSNREIDQAEKTLEWFKYIEKSDAKLVRLRLEPFNSKDEDDLGRSFHILSQRYRWRFKTRHKRTGSIFRSPEWLESRFDRAIGIICRELNKRC